MISLVFIQLNLVLKLLHVQWVFLRNPSIMCWLPKLPHNHENFENPLPFSDGLTSANPAAMASSAGEKCSGFLVPCRNEVKLCLRDFQLPQEHSFHCKPSAVVLAWPQIEHGLRRRGTALLSLELRAGKLAGYTLGVQERSDAKNNRQKNEKQQRRARGMVEERN